MKKNPSQAILDIVRQQGGEPGSPHDAVRALLAYLDEEAERAKPKPVVCPECAAAGTKARIVKSFRGGATRDMYCEPKFLFDEEGREHFHDENQQTHRVGYTCAAGHHFSALVSTPCWCGWEYEPGKPES